MLKLSDIKLAEQCDIPALKRVAAGVLGISDDAFRNVYIHRLSLDARHKTNVWFVYTLLAEVSNEREVLSGNLPNISAYSPPERYEFPAYELPAINEVGPLHTPVIAGMGPAGLFAALSLAEAGMKCIVLERGRPVEQRIDDVERFWQSGILEISSNIQFGEGGAGAFSDGKLTTGVSDRRVRYVLERLVAFDAPDDILYQAKPHIGTDKLCGVIKAIRQRLIEFGCDIRYGHRLKDIELHNGALRGIVVDNGGDVYTLNTDTLILAPGNSARDTFEMLLHRGVKLAPKAFSAGVRIEHLQRDIDAAQYGHSAAAPGMCLPAADYKLASHLDGGRSVYTFCVCPGGQVVAATSENGGVTTNGMSLYARDGENCNGALLVSLTPDDFGYEPLDGVAFQRALEQAVYTSGGGGYFAPAQLVGDFLVKRASVGCKKITPTYKPGVRYCNLWDILPKFICDAIYAALPAFAKLVKGFADPDAVLTAVETRSSSPVRIVRENYETVGVKGIFPCGEGSGYAGGIMSSAVDGIKCAEQVAKKMLDVLASR